MPYRNTLRRAFLAAAVATMATATCAHAADSFPTQRITMIVPFPAGGGSDGVARYLSEPMAKILGQPVVIENLGGNAGAVGAAKVLREKADGYTIMLGSVNETVLLPIVNSAVPYKYSDFTAVGKVGSTPFMVIGRKDLAAKSFDDLIALARKQPGKLSFGSTGVGSYQQIVMEQIMKLAGVSMLHVPYRGAAPLMTDLLGGQIDLGVALPSVVLPQARQGAIKAFGVTGQARDPSAPEVPAISESQSIKNLDFSFWFGVFAPKNMPEDRRAKLAAALEQVLQDPKVKQQLETAGLTVAQPAEQKDFAGFMKQEDQKLRAIASGIKLD
ncbi:tripartite tricarboxylate transporter substrate binding protein [Bordetella sp. N]|uniref:tripartite tricarboxylate transporter substrate binding protein n=1 Tax=Bordetella sp. N TaxID=1746199 RepID=UPI0007101111|nr:tripartite tricarboxylate transporter substrate binding protein [Bordetella sp. N]ALM84418.1 hypothetical protein ASB57_16855 [Bordetella sp. N]